MKNFDSLVPSWSKRNLREKEQIRPMANIIYWEKFMGQKEDIRPMTNISYWGIWCLCQRARHGAYRDSMYDEQRVETITDVRSRDADVTSAPVMSYPVMLTSQVPRWCQITLQNDVIAWPARQSVRAAYPSVKEANSQRMRITATFNLTAMTYLGHDAPADSPRVLEASGPPLQQQAAASWGQ